MKRIIALIIAALALTAFVSLASADGGNCRADQRQRHQSLRIREGARSGELTRAEIRRLHRGQARIHRMERRMKADRTLSRRERMRLERLQDRQSRVIYRLKHNERSI